MKKEHDQPAQRRTPDLRSGSLAGYGFHRNPPVDPPNRHLSWFNDYDEEWKAFVEERTLQKKRPGLNSEEPEPLPRVWNCPHV